MNCPLFLTGSSIIGYSTGTTVLYNDSLEIITLPIFNSNLRYEKTIEAQES